VLVSCDDTREKFNEIFAPAVEAYNAKQKRKDRRITDYYQQCLDNKKMKDPVQEVVIAVGNKDEHPEGEEAVQILTDAFEQFKADNPNLPIMWSVIHMDEATPHLHVAFASMSKGRKNGLSVKAGFDAAYREQGFKVTKANPKPSKVQWQEKQMESLEHVLVSHGHARKKVNAEKRPHEPVSVFKENEKLRQENRQLKEENSQLRQQAGRIKSLVNDMTSGDTFLFNGSEYPTQNALIRQQREAAAALKETKTELKETRAELQELSPRVKKSQTVIQQAQVVEEQQKKRDREQDEREKAQDERDEKQDARERDYHSLIDRILEREREDYRKAAFDYKRKAENLTGDMQFKTIVFETVNAVYRLLPATAQDFFDRLDDNEIIRSVKERILQPSLSTAQKNAAQRIDYSVPGVPKSHQKKDDDLGIGLG
jgi:hypothetical protein